VTGYPITTAPTTTSQASTDLTHTRGQQTIKLGGSFEYGYNRSARNRARTGLTVKGGTSNDIDSLVGLLLGRFDAASRSFGETERHMHRTTFGLFVNDDWKGARSDRSSGRVSCSPGACSRTTNSRLRCTRPAISKEPGHFEIVALRMPKWADARYWLGSVYARVDRLPEGTRELRAAIALEPRHFRANLLPGRILTLQGDAQNALPFLRVAVDSQPSNEEARAFLADALTRTKK
jgi:hypothetical protein